MKAAIFDLDGTLLDTLEDLAESMNAALAEMGFPTHPLDCYRTFVGDGVQILVGRTIPAEHRDEATIQETARRYREHYARNWNRKSRHYDGMLETIQALRQAGLPLAVLSNKPQHFTEMCIRHFYTEGTFEIVFGQRDHVPRKPNPAAALEISAALGIAPQDIAFVGDTLTDMRTAQAAGMVAIGVAWGFRPVEELIENGAAHLVHHPSELMPLLLPLATMAATP